MCNQFAARGYVVANTEYRLGWNPFLPTEPERAASLMRAAYRGTRRKSCYSIFQNGLRKW